jgi:hypothetical protein
MKKIFLCVLICTGLTAGAQNLRLNLYGSYAFDDRVESFNSNTSYFEGKIKGGFMWGGGLEYMVHPQYGVEISYVTLSTTAPMTYYSNQPPAGVKTNTFDLNMGYLMIGGIRYQPFNPKVQGFGGLQIGAAFMNVTRPATAVLGEASDNATKFAWGLRGGVNIFPGGDAGKVGLKLQVGLLSAVQGAGGGLYFGTGGVGAGVSTVSSMLQFVAGGGLVFKFGGK